MALTFPSFPSAFPPLSSSTLHPISHFPFTVYLPRLQTLNAEPFNCRRRHRFSSVLSILPPSASSSSSTPSLDSKPNRSPSSRSTQFKTPRRFSKHSKFRHGRIADSSVEHPAFKPFRPPRYIPPPVSDPDGEDPIRMTEKGLTYKLKDAPFEFQYSYTETPKVKPVALRETPFLPFGPKETPRPWTGKAPLPASKKKLPEFDSFKLPPHGKKGVKPVQSPGPFLAGSGGPRYSATREEILGEPLTKEEVQELVKGCLKTRRQLHMGRDGFTHNMLENIHAHWKRRRVCKIKCLGVCTVDMDNVCQQIEEKTGGKILERKGGVIFLFRGRNYNYKHRPRYPLMLWKPVSPVYPRLVKRVPDGLTFEEAKALRKRGRDVPPIMKLGKNGVYINLVNQVREAFEVCELVRLNCKGMNRSDYKKIGAKLQDLVPCKLLSFEFEHILMWRGRDWKSSFHSIEGNNGDQVASLSANNTSLVNAELKSDTCSDVISNIADEVVIANIPMESSAKSAELGQSFSELKFDASSDATSSMVDEVVTTNIPMECSTESAEDAQSLSDLKLATCSVAMSSTVDDVVNSNTPMESSAGPADGAQIFSVEAANEGPSTETEVEPNTEENKRLETQMLHLEGVRLLLSQAIENSLATTLSELEYHDADIVYQRSVEFAKTARPGPTFQGGYRKIGTKVANIEKHGVLESVEEGEERNTLVTVISEKRGGEIKNGSNRRKDKKDRLLEVTPRVLPHGSLRVDELAKLLS